MQKPKKPKKPKKSDPAPPRKLRKDVHVFLDSSDKEVVEVVFIDDLDIFVQKLSDLYRDEFTERYGDWDPEEAGWDFFADTYERVDLPCSPETIVELAGHLPPGSEDVTFYQDRDEDGYNSGIIFSFTYKRPEAEYLELKNAWANRFKQYTKDLRQYEADMVEYEKWRHQQRVKKLEAELKDLKASNPDDSRA